MQGSDANLVPFGFSTEQKEFRSNVRRFCASRSTSADIRRRMSDAGGIDRDLWSSMASQLGLQSLIVPEQYGGAGAGAIELSIVMEEMGRVLLCAPYLASAVLATQALLRAADEPARSALLPRLADGSLIATLAIAEDSGSWNPDAITLAGRVAGAEWKLDGHKNFVLDAANADVFLVVARTPEGLVLLSVQRNAPGLTVRDLPTLDQTRPLGRLELSGTPAKRLSPQADARTALSAVQDHAGIALAAEQVGVADRCLEMSVQYAKERVQFDRPIGSFQAIKHLCADMFVDVECARSAAYYGAWAAASNAADLPVVATVARVFCSQACFNVAGSTIQVHGGIGYTWDHDAHLYFKRAKSAELILGTPSSHEEALATRAGFAR